MIDESSESLPTEIFRAVPLLVIDAGSETASEISAEFSSEEILESSEPIESSELELGLADLEMLEQEIQVVETTDPQELKLSGISLPAALCDELLLKEIAAIPDRFGFRIGDVAELLGIKTYILRYWETEFDLLKPKKAANNQRYYTKKHVENAFLIRKLLHRDKFSIQGARAALRELKNVVKKEKDWTSINSKVGGLEERVEHLLVELRQLRNLFI
jgi:DNA-binding transcriptional MerR regulator